MNKNTKRAKAANMSNDGFSQWQEPKNDKNKAIIYRNVEAAGKGRGHAVKTNWKNKRKQYPGKGWRP
jgi:hypothetical protein